VPAGDGITIGGCGRSTSLDPVVGDDDGETCTEPGVCAATLDAFGDAGDPLLRLVSPIPMQYAP
jgi:hypothetical protein